MPITGKASQNTDSGSKLSSTRLQCSSLRRNAPTLFVWKTPLVFYRSRLASTSNPSSTATQKAKKPACGCTICQNSSPPTHSASQIADIGTTKPQAARTSSARLPIAGRSEAKPSQELPRLWLVNFRGRYEQSAIYRRKTPTKHQAHEARPSIISGRFSHAGGIPGRGRRSTGARLYRVASR